MIKLFCTRKVTSSQFIQFFKAVEDLKFFLEFALISICTPLSFLFSFFTPIYRLDECTATIQIAS